MTILWNPRNIAFIFQLTSSQGGWRGAAESKEQIRFSTHILTRRMTSASIWYLSISVFSTHILTRRMTMAERLFGIKRHFSTHILTRRMTSQKITRIAFVIFQLTSSQGGWPRFFVWPFYHWFFNSHPHKEDDLCNLQCLKLFLYFQLTSSQGGWLLLLLF